MHSQFEDSKLDNYFAYLNLKRWRCLFLISGDEEYTQKTAQELYECRNIKSSLWISDVQKNIKTSCDTSNNNNSQQHFCQNFKQLKNFLGQEFNFVFLNVFSGLDANVFCQAAGLVKAGGALVLLCPDLKEWAQSQFSSSVALNDYKPASARGFEPPSTCTLYSSPCSAQFFEDELGQETNTLDKSKYTFVKRFIDCFRNSEQSILCIESSPLDIQSKDFDAFNTDTSKKNTEHKYDSSYKNIEPLFFHEQQEEAVALIKRCALGHAKRPVVLYANRGRGKSAALGIAAAQLLKDADQQSNAQIIICAPNIAHVETAFTHAQALLNGSKRLANKLVWVNTELIFLSSEELLTTSIKPALVMIDEAAMFPVAQLKLLAQRFNRLVFATTVHGYEGSGKGFEQRFLKFLKIQSNCVYEHSIYHAARWNDGDSLEAFTHQLCLLDAELKSVDHQELLSHKNYLDQLKFEHLNFELSHERDLEQVFALMVNAHYRTNPRDFQALLDVENLHCFALRYKTNIIAVALIKDEGGLDNEIAQQIIANKRRVNGHLLAQDLLKHSGNAIFASSRGARIMRIMVYPSLQQQGLGSHMLARIKSYLTAHNYDYWGTSFGAHAELLKFWFKNKLLPVRLGHKKQHSSGEYNCLFAESLNNELKLPIKDLNQYFMAQLASQIRFNKSYEIDMIHSFYVHQSDFNVLDPSIESQVDSSNTSLDLNYLNNIQRYVDSELSLEHIFYDASILALVMIKNINALKLSSEHSHFLILMFIYDANIKQLAEHFLLQGKPAVEKQLKHILQKGLMLFPPAK